MILTKFKKTSLLVVAAIMSAPIIASISLVNTQNVYAADDTAYQILLSCKNTRTEHGKSSVQYKECLLANGAHERVDGIELACAEESLPFVDRDVYLECVFTQFNFAAQDEISNWCENSLGSNSADFDTCYSNRLNGLSADGSISLQDNPIYKRINQVIAFLTVGVGLAITISVVIAGIQWSIAGGDPQTKGAAIARLWQSGVALVIFVFGWLILNWLIPGGVLG